jgi:hypothetical protein
MSKEEQKENALISIKRPLGQVITIPESPKSNRNYYYLIVLCTIGIICSQIIINRAYWQSDSGSGETIRIEAAEQARRDAANKLSGPFLDWVEAECDKEIDSNLAIIKDAFEHSKTKTRAYADTALGWYSTWYKLRDMVPFTKKQHGPYLQKEFEKNVISPWEIETAIKKCIEQSFKTIEDKESEMLVKMKKDAPNNSELKWNSDLDISVMHAHFKKIMTVTVITETKQSLNSVIGQGTGKLIAVEISSVIAVKIFQAIAVKLATRGMLSGSAVVSAPFTAGASLIAGLIFDQLISYLWDWYADPKGELAKKINECLDQMCEGAIEGAEIEVEEKKIKQEGLRQVLKDINSARAKLRREATLQLLLQ